MGFVKLIILSFVSYLISAHGGPIQKRQISYQLASDCGSTNLAPLPTIIAGRAALSNHPLRYAESTPYFSPLSTLIAGRAALSPLPLRYAEPMPAAQRTGAFGYEFTAPAPYSPSYGYPIARADDCSHSGNLIASDAIQLPAAPLSPPPPPPPAAPIMTDCQEAPLEFTPIEVLPPPPPPAELPLQMPAQAEPCLEMAQAPILTAPAPIHTEPAELPLPPPPSQIITEPLKSPAGCFESAPAAPAFVAEPLPPQTIELAPPPPPPPQPLESPVFGEQISAAGCHGAAPTTSSFTYPSQPIQLNYGDATHIGAGEGFPEIVDARSLHGSTHTGFGARTGIFHRFAGIAKK